jgi:hypothetical protein
LDFSFEIHSEFEEASMEKVVHLFEIFKTIILLKKIRDREGHFLGGQNLNNLNQFEFDFELNLTAARKCSRGTPVSAPSSPVSRDHASSTTHAGSRPVPTDPRRSTMALVLHVVPSPSLLHGRHPPSAPPFPLPSALRR